MSGTDPVLKKLKVFLLESNLDDIELALCEIRKGQLQVEYDVARNRKEFMERLARYSPDVILADYALSDITGIEAITIVKEMGLDVPVILITGEGNETIAVDCIRHGAIDYILKKNIAGLPDRLRHSLEIWNDRKARERAEAEEMRLQQVLFDNQKMDAVGRLAGGIAHDFNNILTGVMGFAEMCLSDMEEDAPMRNRLEAVVSLSQKGAGLVKELLIFCRKTGMEFKLLDLNSFITETAQFFRRIVEETIEIRLDLHEDIPSVFCDRSQLMRAMINLILNAQDAMQGKGVITLGTGSCVMEENVAGKPAGMQRRAVCLSISDTGAGIDEHTIPRLFDPLFTTRESGKGTGLGLSIVYSVVKAHNGTISVSSRKGEGTTFVIALPAPEGDEAGEGAPFYEKLPGKEDSGVSGKETILIAEDEDVLREMLAAFLRSLGYTVIAARDGDEAFRLYNAEPERCHLIVSDMMMPGKEGIELFQAIRSVRPQAKFILVTGYSLAEVDEQVLAQMTAIIKKPYTPMQIVKLARDIFDA